ncbi:hypothetical protein AGDE_13472 [Angomonas deanei]|uniref:Uncharacterized protein n=1 Tax=Angomonas deanei TaxID=59799 RepID=A0A7G2CLW2_9TRYP|nr:hypothetical protein AGDE_13472 [Angomonas deanei]CAD2219914.1 hypothetical protein, conserved [Angomonas deanei]|eukprot:EPY22319.1 hypothetical protein AGDE_13472 [Angomonas deanei]
MWKVTRPLLIFFPENTPSSDLVTLFHRHKYVSTEEEPPAGRSGKEIADRQLYQFVMEYDHGKRMRHEFGDSAVKSNYFSNKPFSGSPAAAVLTGVGIFMFCLTYVYHLGKPIVDAHRELWSSVDGVDEEGSLAEGEGPIEEEGDDDMGEEGEGN